MSCIVGVTDSRKVTIGSDSWAGNTDVQVTVGAKVWQAGPFLLGVAGDYRVAQILQHRMRPSPPSTAGRRNLMAFLALTLADQIRDALIAASWQATDLGWGGIVGVHGQLFELQHDLSFVEPDCGYTAVGVGAPVAFGALFAHQQHPPTVRVLGALQAAEAHTPNVCRPFHLLTA